MGLANKELSRRNRAAWTGKEDSLAFGVGTVSRECRPYHLGWIMLAGAMFERVVE